MARSWLQRLAWLLTATGVLAVALPPRPAHAACSWVESVTGWNGSLAWSYQHQANWSELPNTYAGQTRDQLSASFELESTFPGQASGLMEGTMTTFGHLDITGLGAPGYTEDQASGPFDAYAPPPPQVMLFLDSFACTYTFLYGPDLGADGTYSVKSGGAVNTTEGIVEPGGLAIPAILTIPELPQPLTFSGQVDAIAEGIPPFGEVYYVPRGPAYNSAEFLGDTQLGKASAQWAFQPEGFQQPLNDTCAGAVPLTGTSQDTTFATTAASDPTPSCGNGDRSVWFLVQAGEAGAPSVETAGSDYDTIVSVWPMAQPCGALTGQIACGIGTATWNAEPNTMYRVQVERGPGGGGGSLTAVVTVPEPGVGAWAAGCGLLALARRAHSLRRSVG
jgi:hypothetical protein